MANEPGLLELLIGVAFVISWIILLVSVAKINDRLTEIASILDSRLPRKSEPRTIAGIQIEDVRE